MLYKLSRKSESFFDFPPSRICQLDLPRENDGFLVDCECALGMKINMQKHLAMNKVMMY